MFSYIRFFCIAFALCFMHQTSPMLIGKQKIDLPDIFLDDPVELFEGQCWQEVHEGGYMARVCTLILRSGKKLENMMVIVDIKRSIKKATIFKKHNTASWDVIAFHVKKNFIAIGNDDNLVEIFDLSNGKLITKLPAPVSQHILRLVVFHQEKNLIAVITSGGEVALWDLDVDTKQPIKTFLIKKMLRNNKPVFHPKKAIIAFKCCRKHNDHTKGERITIFDIKKDTWIYFYSPLGLRFNENGIYNSDDIIERIIFHPTEDILIAQEAKGDIKIYNLTDKDDVKTIKNSGKFDYLSRVALIENRLFTYDQNLDFKIFDLDSKQCIKKIEEMVSKKYKYTVFPLERRFFLATTSSDEGPVITIDIFDVNAGDFCNNLKKIKNFYDLIFEINDKDEDYDNEEDDKLIDDFENLNI